MTRHAPLPFRIRRAHDAAPLQPRFTPPGPRPARVEAPFAFEGVEMDLAAPPTATDGEAPRWRVVQPLAGDTINVDAQFTTIWNVVSRRGAEPERRENAPIVRLRTLTPLRSFVPPIVRATAGSSRSNGRRRELSLTARLIPGSTAASRPESRVAAATPLRRIDVPAPSRVESSDSATPSFVDRLYDRAAPLEQLSVRLLPPSAPSALPTETASSGRRGVDAGASAGRVDLPAPRPALTRAEISSVAQSVLKMIRQQQRLERESKGLI